MLRERVDNYQIMRILGRGGMDEVYLARDLVLGRLVALKIISKERLNTDDGKARFLEEARMTASFNHPNIVAIHGVGAYQDQPYVALEYLEGQTLRERLEEGSLSVKEAMRVVQSIAEALDEAHRHQVLHLDLKPENVMIPRDGRLRVLDFGLSRRVQNAEPRSVGTAVSNDSDPASDVWGTPAYVAPELWSKQAPTPAADIWALGIIAHEVASGRKPFASNTLNAITDAVLSTLPLPELASGSDTERLRGDPSHPEVMPRAFVDLIASCLDKNPTRRPSARTIAAVVAETLSGQRRSSARDTNPFRGLLAFSERHSDVFFGREAEVSLAVERLRETPLLAVVGVSGAGKSSFVQAGLVPRMRERAAWRVVSLRPGSRPFETLAQRLPALGTDAQATTERRTIRSEQHDTTFMGDAARDGVSTESESSDPLATSILAKELAASPQRLALYLWKLAQKLGQNVLLVVDQLEEVVTLVEDEQVRSAFIEAICTAADDIQGPVRVVLTVRDDFLGRLAGGPRVRDALSRVFVLQTPGEEAMREIVSRPLMSVGYTLEDTQLQDAIIAEVRGEPAALPLLQFALGVLWERRDHEHGVIPRAAYLALGGVAGALASHADEVMVGWSPTELDLARALLLRLVTPQRTRRVVGRKRLLAGLAEDSASVLQRLIGARLLSLRQARDVADEADVELAHESLVRSWRRLARWIDESTEELAFTQEIEQAATLWDKRGRRSNEVWQGEGLREGERLLNRGSKLPPHIVDFINAGVRAQREQESEAKQKRATEQAESARSALLRGDYVQARALVRSSLETDDTNLARSLWWTLSQSALLFEKRFGAVLYEVAYAPSGNTIAVASLDTSVYLVDSETTSVRVLRGHDANVITLALAESGRALASGAWSGQVALWDLPSGAPRMLVGHAAMVTAVAFDAAGRLLASGSADDTIRLWDATSGELRATLTDHRAGVAALAFSRVHGLLASASADGTVRVWDARLNVCIRVIETRDGAVPRAVDWSSSGETLCVGTTDGLLQFYDRSTGAERSALSAHANAVSKVRAFGDRLASTGADQTTRFFDIAGIDSGRVASPVGSASGHGTVFGVAFDPTGERAATVSESSLHVWRLSRLTAQESAGVHQGGVESVAFNPLGTMVASGATDWSVRLWSSHTGDCERVLVGHTAAVSSVIFDRAGSRIASGGWDGSSRIWDVATGREISSFRAGSDRVLFVRFSPDETLLATANGDGFVRLYDIAASRLVLQIRAHASECRCIAFSKDGSVLASSSYQDRVIRILNVRDGSVVRELSGHTSGVAGIDFAPDAHSLVSTGFDRSVRLWDLHTGQSRILYEHDARGFKCHFDESGHRIVSSSSDRSVRIWSANGVRKLRGHRGDVNQAVFSERGERVVSGGDDMTVRIWETETGRPCWRSVLLLSPDHDLLTHRGWARLSTRQSQRRLSSALDQRLVHHAKFGASDASGQFLALLTADDAIEVWANDGTQPLRSVPTPGTSELILQGEDVVALADGKVSLLSGAQPLRELAHQATAVAAATGEWLVALPRRAIVLSAQGGVIDEVATDVGVTSLARSGDRLALGFENGFLDLASVRGAKAYAPPFEDTPASAVLRIVFGPMHTLCVGFANGMIGIWSLDTGILLHREQIHGAITALVLDATQLIAASELGESLVLDLHALEQDYASIAAEVKREVQIRWVRGRAERTARESRAAGTCPRK